MEIDLMPLVNHLHSYKPEGCDINMTVDIKDGRDRVHIGYSGRKHGDLYTINRTIGFIEIRLSKVDFEGMIDEMASLMSEKLGL